MKHLTEEEFNSIIANGKMFQLTDGRGSDYVIGDYEEIVS